eukprot:4092242-Amphidinium_carterae.1
MSPTPLVLDKAAYHSLLTQLVAGLSVVEPFSGITSMASHVAKAQHPWPLHLTRLPVHSLCTVPRDTWTGGMLQEVAKEIFEGSTLRAWEAFPGGSVFEHPETKANQDLPSLQLMRDTRSGSAVGLLWHPGQ